MIKNYLKVALRNLTRQKLFSLINVSGLAVGLAVCMMIMLYVTHEHSYDSFHKNADRIVTVRGEVTKDGNVMHWEFFSFATGAVLKQNMPAVQDYACYFKYFDFLPVVINRVSSPGTRFSESKLLFADKGFFNFFSFKLLSGNPANVLNKPFSVVISRNMAKKYFGDEDPVGKTITIKTESSYPYLVTGVAENSPSNSTIDFNFVASSSSLANYKGMFNYLGDQQVGQGFFSTYLLVKNIADTAKVAGAMQAILKSGPPMMHNMKVSMPLLTSLHLTANTGDTSNIKYLTIFPLVAVLILLLALFNYMSLSTARSTLRAKEVGVRKISGASRTTIAIQFYTESALFTILSFILGYLLCYALKPWFLNILQLKIDNAFLYSPTVLILLAALFLITVLVAGSYPALALSSFKPAITLKGKMSKQAGGVILRKIFTTLQFSISIALIICGIIIDRQLYFFRHADTGIARQNVVMVPIPGYFGTRYQPFKKDLMSLAGISDVGTSNYALFNVYDTYNILGKNKDESSPLMAQMVDKDFLSVLGLQWKVAPAAGVSLSNKNISKVVINEAAVSKFNLPENPIGSTIDAERQGKLEVAGVVKNFNFKSMQYTIEPFGLFVVPDNFVWQEPGCSLYARVKPHTNLPSLISAMQTIYKKYDMETPFSYSFMDDVFDAQYKAEDRLASVFSLFTIITISLAALGLFGLAAFTIQQRTKETGVRKILGASLSAIVTLLSADFLKLVILAAVIASPIVWWAMHNWLQTFAYRIPIQLWMFGVSGLLAVVVAVATIGYHAVKAGLANPVKSLRSE